MLSKIASNYLEKIAYGGDMVGDGNSYYDWAPFYSLDYTWDDDDSLDDPERYKETTASMRDLAKALLGEGIATDIDGKPIVHTIMSKTKYNKESNIDSKYWAKQTLEALKAKNKDKIKDLAEYLYIYYGTKDASDLPSNILQDVQNSTKPRKRTLLERVFGVNVDDYAN